MDNVTQGLEKAKDWKELTTEEKIERMREIIKAQTRKISWLQKDLCYIRGSFTGHSHNDNRITVPFAEYPPTTLGTENLSADNYF